MPQKVQHCVYSVRRLFFSLFTMTLHTTTTKNYSRITYVWYNCFL